MVVGEKFQKGSGCRPQNKELENDYYGNDN